MSANLTPIDLKPQRKPAIDRNFFSSKVRSAQTVRRQAFPTHRPASIQPGTGPARRVDLLAAERGNNRITEAQFIVGRMIQAVFERGSGARFGTVDWGAVRSAGSTAAHELAIILRLEDAGRVRRFSDRLEAEIDLDERLHRTIDRDDMCGMFADFCQTLRGGLSNALDMIAARTSTIKSPTEIRRMSEDEWNRAMRTARDDFHRLWRERFGTKGSQREAAPVE